ncbi:MAG: ankyrin repeat domain-containing protein, partial [Verrucomicrobiae bacterium]|nr:ankyrin repeat domain-containing protein [Verrucomicrobiae bacterium]
MLLKKFLQKMGWICGFSLLLGGAFTAAAVDEVTLSKSRDTTWQDEPAVAKWFLDVKRGDAAAVSRSLEARQDVEARGKDGWSALMWAAYLGHAEIVQKLIAAGARLDAVNAEGDTALMLACAEDREDVAEMLLKAGSHPNLR